MLTKSTLLAYANMFASVQRSKGYSIFKADGVKSVKHDKTNKIIEAEVHGDGKRTVTMTYKSNHDISSGMCTCTQRSFCKHQSALIQHLLEDAVVVKEEQLVKEGRTDEFRPIQINTFHEFDRMISNLYDKRYTRNPSSYAAQFVNDNLLHFHKVTTFGAWNQKTEEIDINTISVELKRNDGSVEVKCHECSRASDKLCNHAIDALYDNITVPFIEEFIGGNLDYESHIKTVLNKEKWSRAFFDKHYRLFLKYRGIELYPVTKNLMIGDDWSNFLESINSISSKLTFADSEFVSNQSDNYNSMTGNAMVWSTATDFDPFEVIIVRGIMNKSRTKLSSHITVEPEPSAAGKSELDFYNNYIKTIEAVEAYDIPIQWSRVQDFIDQNVYDYNRWLHYYHNPQNGYFDREDGLKKKDLTLITMSKRKAGLIFDVQSDDELATMNVVIDIDGEHHSLDSINIVLHSFVVINNVGYRYVNANVMLYLLQNHKTDSYSFEPTENPKAIEAIFRLSQKFNFNSVPSFLHAKPIELNGGKKKLLVKEAGPYLTFEPVLSFDQVGDFNIFSVNHSIIDETTEQIHYYNIDPQTIEEFTEFMDDSHPNFQKDRDQYEFYFLSIDEALSGNWFLEFFEACKEAEVDVFGDDNLNNFKFNKNKAIISNSVASGIDWFDVDIDIKFGEETVTTTRWIEAIRNKEKYVQLSDGTLGILPEEWMERLEKLSQVAETENGQLQISKLSFNVVEELFEELGEQEALEEIRAKKRKLREFESIKDAAIPSTIKATMRDYQIKGYHWLLFLDEFNFGGCLADDMGLGKTLEVICFLAQQKEQGNGTNLVVVPRSLLFNWGAEIDKFCPDLRYHVHHGPNRNAEKVDFAQYDIIISTYDTTTIDIELMRETTFNYCVLDESQAIKNPNSKRYKAMRLIKSRNKIVMTGTPIENNTFDLFGQFSFINPGLFSSQRSFRDRFAVPIDTLQDKDAAEMLRKMVYPFLLRRTKEQVASDLPEKTESVLMCTMGPHQRKLYNELKRKVKDDVANKIQKDGLNKSKFKILEGLLRLRQMCNSPLLINDSLTGKDSQSTKIETLTNHISEVILGHKALIFSQFVGMLSLIRKELDSRNISYAYLDGSTRNRQAAVDQFQNDPDCKIFLISLKAGNTGLNLVAAEYVYLVDPWWNPAVEAQAIDRTHRIGQNKNVFAYKMICKDSIEEKILKLQDKKKKIASDIIRTDENILKSLSQDNLMALFD